MGDQFKFVGQNHYHGGERLEDGQVVEPTENELAHFGRQFEPVEESDSDEGNRGADSSTESESEESVPFDPSEYTLSELEGELEDADLESSADELHERENEGQNRTGAHEIISAVVGE